MDTPSKNFLSCPTEIIQKIGSYLPTPAKLLDYACVCKRVSSAIDLEEFVKKDIQCLQAHTSDKDEFLWSRQKNISKYPHKCIGNWNSIHDIYLRPYLELKPRGSHVPSINWAIETGADISKVKEIINIYSTLYPSALRGLWYPNHCRIDKNHGLGYIIAADYPSPLILAAKSGRVDVMQALVESGIEVREWCSLRLFAFLWDGRSICHPVIDTYINIIPVWLPKRGPILNVFALACEANEKAALFLINNGYIPRFVDFWWPVKYGHAEVVGIVAQQSHFKAKFGQRAILNVLSDILLFSDKRRIKDMSIIEHVLDNMRFPTRYFTAVSREKWLREATRQLLRREGSDYQISLGIYLFNLLKKSGSELIVDIHIARRAARTDKLLEITKAILPRIKPTTKQGKRLLWKDVLLSEASRHICVRTVECLLSHNYKFSALNLLQAIKRERHVFNREDQLEVIDMIVKSGVSVNSKHRSLVALDFTLSISETVRTGDDRQGMDCLVALRLLHHGADLEAVSQRAVEYWISSVYHDQYLMDYFLHVIPHKSDPKDISREIFSEKVESVDSPLYLDQVYAMAVLLRGRDFLESHLRKVIQRADNLNISPRSNGFQGPPMPSLDSE
ncbi:hypothetical protein F4811DRAFT_569675 [Daldinia bambusicola]|nr:hypothetical protein F4811DRAFT_569675 [Daldinia bambusicola]